MAYAPKGHAKEINKSNQFRYLLFLKSLLRTPSTQTLGNTIHLNIESHRSPRHEVAPSTQTWVQLFNQTQIYNIHADMDLPHPP